MNEPPDPLADTLIAARLVAGDPNGFGGLWLRGADEGVGEAVLAILRAHRSCRKLPLNIDEDRLTGGLDVAATLSAGRPVHQAGLLEEMRDGVLVIANAERLSSAIAGRIAAAMDAGGPSLLLLSDGREEDAPPACLIERVAFHLDESAAPSKETRHPGLDPGSTFLSPEEEGGCHWQVQTSPGRLQPCPGDMATCSIEPGMTNEGKADAEALTALAATSVALGITSARTDLFALRAARAHAELHGRTDPIADDLAFAARIILAPRATQFPAPPEEAPQPDAAPQPSESETLKDVVLEAARSALPPDVLAALLAGNRQKAKPRGQGTGGRSKSPLRGRPLGARAGLPGAGARLALIDTLRAAAPWQRLRGRTDRLLLRRDDLRIRRFESRSPALTIVAVDASGSAAAARLAEAKGAVELLLHQSYVRRAEVALVAFRGKTAELLLPPTRSLTRARRLLADLPGGGGTPLAAGIDAARTVAAAATSRGRTPALVLLTDGRANIAADGRQDRAAATADADAAARRIASAGLNAMVIDIGARPQPEAARLAAAMAGRYLHLPRADAARVHAALA